MFSSLNEAVCDKLLAVTLQNFKFYYFYQKKKKNPNCYCYYVLLHPSQEDEFVVYSADQQCIQYVVEFTFPEDNLESFKRQVSVDETDSYYHSIEKPITKIGKGTAEEAVQLWVG